MDIVRLNDVGMDFDGKWPLRDVCFALRRGEFVILSGPNGSGKTTLLRIILKLLKPTEGKVEYFDESGKPAKHIRIGELPQKSKIDTKFPIVVEEAILSGLRHGLFGRLPAEYKDRMDRITDLCGVKGYLNQPIGTLSGGQLQRTLLARAIIGDPELLVLDEPLSYVDKEIEQNFYSMVADLSKRMTILLVSHELSGLAPLADRQISISSLLQCSKDSSANR